MTMNRFFDKTFDPLYQYVLSNQLIVTAHKLKDRTDKVSLNRRVLIKWMQVGLASNDHPLMLNQYLIPCENCLLHASHK